MSDSHKTTNITFVRHGETEFNTKGYYFGHLNPSLNLEGNIQAENTAELLKQQKFDIIYSSDLIRCYKTSKIINTYHNLEIITSEYLREKNFGIFEGKTYKQITELFPEKSELYFNDWKNYIIPKGESLSIMQNRCVKFIEEITNKHKGKSILVVTHSGIIKALLAHYLSENLDSFWKYKIDYASMTKLIFNSENYAYAEYINRI